VQLRTFTVADVSDVAVQGLNVVPIRVEQVSRVVARAVVTVPRRAIRPKTGLDSRTVEGVDLLFTPRVEAQMQIGRRGSPVQDVEVSEVSPGRTPRSLLVFCDLRDSERR
jgi:hypothetical protein